MTTRIAFITGIPTHHQIPFGKAMYNILGKNFRMFFTSEVPTNRLSLGWDDGNSYRYEWITRTWESDQQMQLLQDCIANYDVVIYGAVPTELVRKRILSGKLTFRGSERLFKYCLLFGSLWWLRRIMRDFWPLNKSNHHLLAEGAYCARDHQMIRMFKGRIWKWGYFTDVPQSPPIPRNDENIKILWAGRMLVWKRVDLIFETARRLVNSDHSFTIDLIGDGPEKNNLIKLQTRYGLQNFINFIPSTPFEKVREHMKKANIYIMPSNFREGWGAVINEAMSVGCCVVASKGAGAAPWLIENNTNGYLFENGNIDQLCLIISDLIKNKQTCATVGFNAWSTMQESWSPEVAASRFVILANYLLGNCDLPYFPQGPCSPC